MGMERRKFLCIRRLAQHCPLLSSDLCFVLCTCENTLQPVNPWLSETWTPSADVDPTAPVHYVPSPKHRHTWVVTINGLREALEVLKTAMRADMLESIMMRYKEAERTMMEMHNALQIEMRFYAVERADVKLHTRWEISWNKNEQEAKEWEQSNYQEVLKQRADVQFGRRHVMQTTGMTEAEVLQRIGLAPRRRRTTIGESETGEQLATPAPPMRTYFQRGPYLYRTGAATEWLSEACITAEEQPVSKQASENTQSTADLNGLGEAYMSVQEAAQTGASIYTRAQAMESGRMSFTEWVRYAHSLRWGPAVTSGSENIPPSLHLTYQQQQATHHHLPPPLGRVYELDIQAQAPAQDITINGEPQQAFLSQNMEIDALVSASRQQSQPTAHATNPDVEQHLVFPTNWDPSATASANTVHSTEEELRARARAIDMANRAIARRRTDGQPQPTRAEDAIGPEWLRPGSQARADDAAMRERLVPNPRVRRGAISRRPPILNPPGSAVHFEAEEVRTVTRDMANRRRVRRTARRRADDQGHNTRPEDVAAPPGRRRGSQVRADDDAATVETQRTEDDEWVHV